MNAQAQSLPVSVRTLWRRIAVLRAVMLSVFGIPLALMFRNEVGWMVLALPIGASLIILGIGWWWATARWKSWSFDLTTRWITATWGVWTQRTVTIPRNRVQTVTTNDGPIDRFLKLQTITMHTAGAASPNLQIPHLEVDTVQWLRNELGQGVAAH